MKTHTPITPFVFEDHLVRTIEIDGQIGWITSDLGKALGYKNIRETIRHFPENEKGLITSDSIVEAGVRDSYTSSGNAAEQRRELGYVTEPGLYRLIFRSNLPAAERFQTFVFHEVLPTIRRTGSYCVLPTGMQRYLAFVREQIALGVSPDLAARMAGKLTNIPKEELDGYSATPALERDIDEVTRHMQPGTSYSPVDLVELLAASHPMRLGSKASVCSSMGKLMTKAALLHRVEKLPGRNVRYRLPVIAAFPGTASK